MIPAKIGDMVVMTLRDPGTALRVLQGLDLPMSVRWMALALAVTLSTLLSTLSLLIFPIPAGDPMGGLFSVPLMLAGVQFASITLAAFCMAFVGRLFGGRGDFPDALLAIAWIEMILVGLQAMQLLLMLILPGAANVMFFVASGLFLYLVVAVTKALHGFTSTPKVVVGFVGSLFVMGFALSLIAAALGILPEVTP